MEANAPELGERSAFFYVLPFDSVATESPERREFAQCPKINFPLSLDVLS